MTVVTPASADASQPPPGADAGPPYKFATELKGAGSVGVGMKDAAWLTRSKHGYRLRTGQQDSHLVVTLVNDRLRFVDTGTKSFKRLSPACHRKNVRVGVVAVCRVPGNISVRRPLLVEVWPRLGNDFTDTSTLPATFAVTMLGDKGRDVAHFGAGRDFFNGFSGRDHVWGSGGNDWIRAGIGNDVVNGGGGNDDIVAVDGRDTLHGGGGDDRLWAGEGDDRLSGDAGADFLLCGAGHDRAKVDASDRVSQDCEARSHG
jgi:serralysin